MKNWTSTLRLALCTGALFTVGAVVAAETPSTPEDVVSEPAPVATAPAAAAPVKLPYGVDDVLKLSRARVSDEIIQGYIQNSGTIYSLGPNDIVYLRDQGVSDRVISTMLDQRKRLSEAGAPAPAPAQVPASVPTYTQAPSAAAAPTYNAAPPATVEVQSQPAPSTLYIIPYPQATSAYYDYYTPYYYGPYWRGYCGPALSFGFRFGGGWGHGGWHGGYHGGYHGGWHRHH